MPKGWFNNNHDRKFSNFGIVPRSPPPPPSLFNQKTNFPKIDLEIIENYPNMTCKFTSRDFQLVSNHWTFSSSSIDLNNIFKFNKSDSFYSYKSLGFSYGIFGWTFIHEEMKLCLCLRTKKNNKVILSSILDTRPHTKHQPTHLVIPIVSLFQASLYPHRQMKAPNYLHFMNRFFCWMSKKEIIRRMRKKLCEDIFLMTLNK